MRFCALLLVAFAACVAPIVAPRAASASAGGPLVAIRVPIWPQAEGDKPAQLSLRDLSAQVRGRKLTPDLLLGPDSDLFLLIALDLTGDIATATDAKDVLAAEIEKLPPRTYVSALNCQDELRVLEDPTINRARMITAIRSLEVAGRSGLLNCIERVESIADAMLERSSVRVGVIFITDATVQNYREDLINPVINSSDPNDLSRRFPEQLVQNAMASLARRMEPSLAPLFVVQLAYVSDRWNEAYYDGLRTLAGTTMGEASFCATRAAIPDSVERCFSRLQAHYSARLWVAAQAEAVDVELKNSSSNAPRLSYRSRFTLRPK